MAPDPIDQYWAQGVDNFHEGGDAHYEKDMMGKEYHFSHLPNDKYPELKIALRIQKLFDTSYVFSTL